MGRMYPITLSPEGIGYLLPNLHAFLMVFLFTLSSWLFGRKSSLVGAIPLLFGIIFDIKGDVGQVVFLYGQLFRRRFELVATASVSF